MPLLLRLFFIRRSKNNRRRSHAGSEGRTVFQKKQTCQVVWSLGMSRRGTAPAKLARLCSKNSGSARAPWPYAQRRTKTRLPRGLAGTLWNGRFSTTGCALDVEDFRKTRPARRTQADAPEAVFGHSKKFNPLLPACKRTAHPDQEQQIQSRQGQSRKVMAAGAPGQEDVNQPERFSGLQRTVEAWQLSGPGLPAQARPGRSTGLLARSVGGYGGAGEQARSARSSGIPRDPGPCCRGHVGRCGSREIRLPTGCVQVACGQSASSLIEKISRDQ